MKTVGEFEYDEKDEIGRGAFGKVYTGHKKTTLVDVAAIKVIDVKNYNLTQLPNSITREMQILETLSNPKHDNIVTLFHCEQQDQFVYFVMELCNGGNLREYLQSEEKLNEVTIRMFLKQIAAGLKAAHDTNIIHRDLKPENILLSFLPGPRYPSPHNITLKIADFGIGRLLKANEMASTHCGTPFYMAPEICMFRPGGYDFKADLWSVGVIAYECHEGSLPKKSPMAVIDIEIPLNITKDFANLLSGLLEKDEKKRFDTEQFMNHQFLAVNISLPNIIDDEDLASMNQSRGSRQKKSRTVMLQTQSINMGHRPLQTDTSKEDKLIGTPMEPDCKSTAKENNIWPKSDMGIKIAALIVGATILVTAIVGLSYARSCYVFIKQSKKKKEEESEIENVQCISEDVHVAKRIEVKQVDAATQSEVQSVRGLQNLGNTCYFNSTMQALVHTNSVFREKLEMLRTKGEFIQEVLTFLSVMHSDNSRPYSPNKLHHLFCERSPRFANYRQHDSHECLRNFLDNIRKEERENSGAADKRKVLTVVDSVFGGHFITVYICKECKTPSHVFEALLDISLSIMIDEEDLAAMNSARDSKQKKSRTVMMQTRGSKRKHHASQTDKLEEAKNCNDSKEVKDAEEREQEYDDVSFDEGVEDEKVAEQEEQEDEEEEEYHEAKEEDKEEEEKEEEEEEEEEEVDDDEDDNEEEEEEVDDDEDDNEEEEEGEEEEEEEDEEEKEEEEEAEEAEQRLQQQQQQQQIEKDKEYHEEEVVVEGETEDDDEDSDEEVYVEVVEEDRDDYRVAIDELMTPLSLSSPCLPIDERATKKHVTVHDCLSYFTRIENITKEYLCNDCYARNPPNEGEDPLLTSATKQTLIFNPPTILTLHLKRFELKEGRSVKRNDMITYEELLDIAPYCSAMCLRNDPPSPNIWYSLYGVVVHHGSTLKSGHYTAYVKLKESVEPFTKKLKLSFFDRDLTRERLIETMHEKSSSVVVHKQSSSTWYCMNDSSFHKVPVKKVLNQEAYLLFYERMS